MERLAKWAAAGMAGLVGLGFTAVACAAPASTGTDAKPGLGQTTLPSGGVGSTGGATGGQPATGAPSSPPPPVARPGSSEAVSSGAGFAAPARAFPAAPDSSSFGAPQYASGSGQQEGIWVNGLGRVSVAPDVGALHVRVEAQDKTVSAAREKAAAAMRAILDAVKRQGVAEKDIQTQYFNIQPIYHWEEAVNKETGARFGKQVLDGYQVTNSINVKVRDLAKFDAVIDSAVAAGGDLIRIDSVALTVEDSSKAQAEARTKAMKDALAHAQQLAAAAGVTLGKPVFITESGGYAPPPVPYARAEMALAKGADVGQATPIQTGEMEITVSVQAVFAIQ